METPARPEPRRMYSWWWDSHISPKNSKWLQENLTDMDAKVKAMIKLIEEDADSFARRAEMYYKKRPELMKLVEEFYRAYRALAERYDHATGVLRQAHRTMAEAFPNQVPLLLGDDSPLGSTSDADPQTPEISPPMRALQGPDDLQKDSFGLSSSHFHAVKRNGGYAESDSVTNKKGLKQFGDLFASGGNTVLAEGKVRKGLNFHGAVETEQTTETKENHVDGHLALCVSELSGKYDKEIQKLKEDLAKLEAEKEASLAQYQQSLERLSKLESEVSYAQEQSRGLTEQANKAEGEVQSLREALNRLEVEREASLLQYQQCLERIANLENVISHAKEDADELNDRASRAENEAQALKQDLTSVVSEKDAALDKYMQSLEKISALENKLLLAEEEAKKLSERADKAEREVETLKQELSKLTEEKEAVAQQYQECLRTISSLEYKISSAEEKAQRLREEVNDGVAKLKGAEERCTLLERSNQSLHSELESLVLKMGAQREELTEKQQEVGRLWTCIQEERSRYMEAETAFQTLQHLHSETQEELRSLALELQNRAQILREVETRSQSLQDEVLKIKEENKSLNEINLSSAMSIKDMQNEIFSVKETKGKLEQEVELRVDQRNALQQEIYCLKEELNDLNKKYQVMLNQVEAVGFNPESFHSSVKELQDGHSNLKETYERERSEKEALLGKLEIMEQLLEKNAHLEKSLSDLSAELEGTRGKINALEASLQSLLEEKSILVSEKAILISQLEVKNDNLEKLSEKNTFLENSLSDAHDELEGLKVRSKSLEDSCQLLENEKSDLINEKYSLVSQVEITGQLLQDREKSYRELGEKYSDLEKQKESALQEIEELCASLDVERRAHASFSQKSETQLAGMENQIRLLQEEDCRRRRDLEGEQDKSMNYQLEIFILQRFVQDLVQRGRSLLIEFQKLLEASKLSEQLISELEHENLEQQEELKSLSDQNRRFRMDIVELSKALEIDLDHRCESKIWEDQAYLNNLLSKLEDTKCCLCNVQDENQQLAVEMAVLLAMLGQIKLEAMNVEMDRKILDQELNQKNEQLSVLQLEANRLLEMNEELQLKVKEGDQKEEILTRETENLHEKLVEIQGAYQNLEKEKLKMLEENSSLTKEFFNLEAKNHDVQDENQQLAVEIAVLLAMLGQIKLEAVNVEMDRKIFHQELSQKNEQLSVLQIEANRLLEMNEELQLRVKEGDQKEEILTTEIQNLQRKLVDIQGACQNLEKENLKMLEENRSLTREFSNLEGKNRTLDEENSSTVAELLSLSNISLVFENMINEKSMELKDLGENLDKLQGFNAELEGKLRTVEGMLQEVRLENLHLKDLLKNSEDKLRAVTFVSDQLQSEVAKVNDLLNQKEIELSKSESKVTAFENEKSELETTMQDMKRELYEVRIVRDDQEKHILKLYEDKDHISKENECLKQANSELKVELGHLHEDHENTKGREESLFSEVQRQKNEIDLWENEGMAVLGQLQISAIHQVLLEEKVHELAEACKCLKGETTLKDTDIGLLKDRLNNSESENRQLNAQLAAYISGINSLEDCISSLENQTNSQRKVQDGNKEDVKYAESATCHDVGSPEKLAVSQNPPDGYLELQNLQKRVKAIESLVVDRERIMAEESINTNAKLEATMRQIEELKSKGGSSQENFKPMSECESGLLTKDIMLDQISDCSSYGISRREKGTVNYQEAEKMQKGEYPVSEIVEKELSVDKLEISRTFSAPRREINKIKILERLNSDVRKLTNLQITVQDLKKQVEVCEKSKKSKAAIDCDSQKRQLEEAEEAIQKLFDLNNKLMKSIEEKSYSGEGNMGNDSEESSNARRRRILEQAQRVSERIGRLQVEIQKIQLLLLKLHDENENESKGKAKVTETRRRVLLRDYLYGGGRTGSRKKRAPFCGCVHPPTRED
ncbi:hypothetical protein NMG60_11014021 [Bertholletia excelsa]